MWFSLGTFIQTTIGVIVFSIAGVSGAVGEVEITEVGMVAEIDEQFGIALPPVAYVPDRGREFIRRHEQGHLVQARQIGMLYYPVVGIASAVYFHTGAFGDGVERWATDLGGEL
jgi:hypothetical protein